jgi:hypothetical protein
MTNIMDSFREKQIGFLVPIQEAMLECDDAFLKTALEKEIDQSMFVLAWWIRDYHLIPMKFTLNRILNEHGRVFKSIEEQESKLWHRQEPHPQFVSALKKFHRRIYNNKEYVAKMQQVFS